jgi:hypothetical protein
VSDTQLLARVNPAALTAQPLSIEQMRPGDLNADAGTAQAVDRLAVEEIGGITRVQ